ncbi:MAG: VWA domain-containing protein, partial [Proteobacteria bacterium]|nr:VWA domain-containing protein [Pseudomonadota bacterium]
MSINEEESFYYTVNHRIYNRWPGPHKSNTFGPGNDFQSVVPFIRAPEPKRIDVRSTIRNPFQNLYIKQFRQRSRLSVNVIVDVSTSMNFAGRLTEVKRFLRSTYLSAAKLKD